MKLINCTYKHAKADFEIKVITCNAKIVTCHNTTDNKEQKFNRGKFEWMISKGIFIEVKEETEALKPASNFVKEKFNLTPEQAQKLDSLPIHERKAFLAEVAKENGATINLSTRKQRLSSRLTSACPVPALQGVKQFTHDVTTVALTKSKIF